MTDASRSPAWPRRALFRLDGRLRAGWVIAVFAAVLVAAFGGGQWLAFVFGAFERPLQLDRWAVQLLVVERLAAAAVATVVAAALGRRALFAWIADRAIARHLGLGLFLGAMAMGIYAWVPFWLGSLSWERLPEVSWAGGLSLLGALFPAALAEELAVRGLLLRELGSFGRPWLAVGASSLIFGVMHLGNPGASWFAAANVTLVGIWFGTLAVRTQSIWMSTGAHLAWNWMEGFVLGCPVSGIPPGPSVLRPQPDAPLFFSGGSFGPEAAGFTTLLLLALAAGTLAWPRAKGPSQWSSLTWTP